MCVCVRTCICITLSYHASTWQKFERRRQSRKFISVSWNLSSRNDVLYKPRDRWIDRYDVPGEKINCRCTYTAERMYIRIVDAPLSCVTPTFVHCTSYNDIPRRRWIFLVYKGLWGKVRQEILRWEESRDSGRDRGEIVLEDGERRGKREAPNTQHNPAASSASMDFKRSPRLLLFRFLSFSFFYYYFRGADRCALAPIRAGVCVYHVCTALYVSTSTRVYNYVCVSLFQVELGRAWVGLDAWKPWTTLGRLVGFPPRLSARIEAHRHGSNVGTTAAAWTGVTTEMKRAERQKESGIEW